MRRLLTAALGLAAVLLGTACDPPPSTSADVFNRPADGIFRISGHGWGHGRGMSQWGAEGAATLGVSSDTILATYYPGTAKTIIPNTPIRVLIGADDTVDVKVLPAAGLTVTDAANRRLTVPTGAKQWRILSSGTNLVLQRLDTTWTNVPVAGSTALASPVRFTTSSGIVSVVLPDGSSRDYRGYAQATRRSPGGLYSIAVLPMESYLRGVVPQESPASWKPAALQAQAVAARTYAAQQRATSGSRAYDICDSTSCQVFAGNAKRSASGVVTATEYASTDAAIAATAGHIRTFNGQPAFTQFSSSNGGYSVDGGYPYLVAKADPWDGVATNSVHTWTAQVSASTLEARFPTVGHLTRVRISSRDGRGDWGGRVNTVVLEGTDRAGKTTSVTVSGSSFVAAYSWPSYSAGLRSTYFTITS